MSIGEWPEEQPSRVRLTKALSWHYPNREYFHSLIVENHRQRLQCVNLPLQQEDSQLDGSNNDESCENLRIRLSRLNSFMTPKSRTKAHKWIHAGFRSREQELNEHFDETDRLHTIWDTPCDSQQPPKDVQSFERPTKNNLGQGHGVVTIKRLVESKASPTPGQRATNLEETQASPEMTKDTPDQAPPPANPATSSVPSQKRRIHTVAPPAAWQEPGAPRIPPGLSTEDERECYRRLIRVRMNRGLEGQSPPEIVVITDLAKDYDDLSAMIVLKELHRIGLIKLVGFIANLHPPRDRAQFGRGCLDYLGLEDIPICWGEEAEANPSKIRDPSPWEFPYKNAYFKNFSAHNVAFTPYDQDKRNVADHDEIESGINFLERIIQEKVEAREKDSTLPKFTFLLLSGLADTATITKRQPEKLALTLGNVVLQGDYKVEQGPTSYHGILTPNLKAANNGFDTQATKEFHEYIENYHIPSIVFTRASAFASRHESELFTALKDTGHPLGEHLEVTEKLQDATFYENACDPVKRFAPNLDQDWFLHGKTDWYDRYPKVPADGSPQIPPPSGKTPEAIIPYTKLVFYDVLAAIGAAGDDVIGAIQILEPKELFVNQEPHIHKVVGREEPNPDDPGAKLLQFPEINVSNMKTAVSALLKGSLSAYQLGIPSTHTTWQMWTRANERAGRQGEGR